MNSNVSLIVSGELHCVRTAHFLFACLVEVKHSETARPHSWNMSAQNITATLSITPAASICTEPYVYNWHIRQPVSVRFDVFTAVTMTNGVFWDVTPCGSCENRLFRGTYCRVTRIGALGTLSSSEASVITRAIWRNTPQRRHSSFS
jgi:hypothetical protein